MLCLYMCISVEPPSRSRYTRHLSELAGSFLPLPDVFQIQSLNRLLLFWCQLQLASPALELPLNGITQPIVSPFQLLSMKVFVRFIHIFGSVHGSFPFISIERKWTWSIPLHEYSVCYWSMLLFISIWIVSSVAKIPFWLGFYHVQDIKEVAFIQRPRAQRCSLLMETSICLL